MHTEYWAVSKKKRYYRIVISKFTDSNRVDHRNNSDNLEPSPSGDQITDTTTSNKKIVRINILDGIKTLY